MVGSNQYRIREGDAVPPPAGDLVGQVAPPVRRRCEEMWGTNCRAWVRAPSWSHGRHGIDGGYEIAALNPGCPSKLLRRMAGVIDSYVRCAVGGNPNTPADTLAQLAQDAEAIVRRAVASNRGTPPKILVVLLADRQVLVRRAAVKNPHLPEEYRSLHRVTQ